MSCPCCTPPPAGGKNVKEEQAVVNSMNILVATPGRLLQHMDETPGFDASNLQVRGAGLHALPLVPAHQQQG